MCNSLLVTTNSKTREDKLAVVAGVVPATHPPRETITKSRRSHSSRAACHHHEHVQVQHHYHDFSVDLEPSPEFFDSSSSGRSGSSSVAPPFPTRLYDMLQDAQANGISHIISFAPHGRAIQVHEPKKLVDILPKYFTLSKISSFQRQLNLYGFKRLTRGGDRGCYYHELFLRGHPWLLGRMHRVKVKGTFVRARSNPENEPDLWSLPWVGEAQETPVPRSLLVPSMSSMVRRLSSSEPHTTNTATTRKPSLVASVVSQDDDEEENEDKDMDDGPPPFLQDGIKSVSVCMATDDNIYEEEEEDEAHSEDDDAADESVLTTWGMPFHAWSSSTSLAECVGTDARAQKDQGGAKWIVDDDESFAKTLDAMLNEQDDTVMSMDLTLCEELMPDICLWET